MAKPKESIPALTPLNFKEGKLKSNSLDKSIDAGDCVDKYDPSIFCRTCANLDPCLVPIFKDEGLDYNLHRKIEKYLPIQVSEKDDLPIQICYHCASTLIAWDTLVEGCVEAEKKLTALKKSSKTKDSDEVEDGGELIIAEIDSDDEPLIAKKLAPERVEVGEKRDILQEKNDFQDLLEPIDMESERLMEEPDLSFSNYQHQFSMYRLLYFEIFSLRIESAFCCNICAVLDEVKMKFLKSLTRLNNENNDKENDKQTDKRNKEAVLVEEGPVERQKGRVRKRSGPDGELVCENCGKVCLTRLSWRNHMRIHRSKEFPCRQCGKIFTCRFNLVRHVQGVHEHLKKHVCKTCGKRYRSRSEMNDHRTVHKKKVEKIVCEDCGRMYLTKASFYSHRKLHREVKESGQKKIFSCDECHKTFTTKKSKIDHTLIHTGEKPLSCDVCKKNFRTRKGLEQHMPIHTGVKPYDCKHCGKAFARKDHLRIHIRCHTGEKPYTCEYCGKGCAQLTDIKKHLKTHTRVR